MAKEGAELVVANRHEASAAAITAELRGNPADHCQKHLKWPQGQQSITSRDRL